MRTHKTPSFAARAASAAKAKREAIEAYLSKVESPAQIDADRYAGRLAHEAALAARRDEKRAAWEQKILERKARAAEKRKLEEAASQPVTDSEIEAARKARYSLRKPKGR